MGRCPASYAGGGVIGPSTTAAHDPSVADYRDTSPYEWGGFANEKARCSRSSGPRRAPGSNSSGWWLVRLRFSGQPADLVLDLEFAFFQAADGVVVGVGP